MPSELPPEIRHELTRLRAIMYEPSSVWLATWANSERWLTDQYVMLDVTDSCIFEDYPADDGGYKLVASKGFEARDTIPEPDLDVYFARMDELADWHPAQPSEWSVAEHPGKAMLWTYVSEENGGWGIPNHAPCLLGESTWTALKRHHADCSVDYSPERNVFRFTDEQVFCFAAGIRIPTGQEDVADAIALAAHSTSNGDAS